MPEFDDGPWRKFTKASKQKGPKSLDRREAFLAWSLVMKYKPKVVLELGSQFGHSGIIWLDAVKRTGGVFIGLDLGRDKGNKYSAGSQGTMELLPDNDPQCIKCWGDAVELLPELLKKYDVGLVFHDAAHTWDHVKSCVNIVKHHDPNIIQTCHDCVAGIWKPEQKTRYGYICAERPVFDECFKGDYAYRYRIYPGGRGFGMVVSRCFDGPSYTGTENPNQISVAVGPKTKAPSWMWVGHDTGKELSKYYNVKYYSGDECSQVDIVLAIKHPPSVTLLNRADNCGAKVVYCPIDYFTSMKQIGSHAVPFHHQ